MVVVNILHVAGTGTAHCQTGYISQTVHLIVDCSLFYFGNCTSLFIIQMKNVQSCINHMILMLHICIMFQFLHILEGYLYLPLWYHFPGIKRQVSLLSRTQNNNQA